MGAVSAGCARGEDRCPTVDATAAADARMYEDTRRWKETHGPTGKGGEGIPNDAVRSPRLFKIGAG